MDSYIAQQESETQHSIQQLPLLKQEYERYLLLQLFDFRSLLYQQESMVRIFAEFFYHSHASLKQLHDQTLQDLRQQVISVADKWQQKIQSMPFETLRDQDFLERVERSAEYFADMLEKILAKPLELTAKVETNNKQAARRLANALPEERQTWLSYRYLLMKIAVRGFTVSIYLKEKQHAMLDAIEADELKPRRQKKAKVPKPPKEKKPKTWEVSYQLYCQGMKPDLIAHERGLTIGTVNGHLFRYVESGKVSFDDLVLPEHQQAILAVVQKIGTSEGTTAIKNLCPPDVTYDDIRLVLSNLSVRPPRTGSPLPSD